MTKSVTEDANVDVASTEGSMITVKEHEQLTLGTSIQFGSGSVCHWHLVVNSAYGSLKKIQLQVEVKSDARVYTGSSFTDIMEKGSYKKLVNGQTLEFNSDEHLIIITHGKASTDYLKVSYQLIDIISPAYFGLIVVGFILALSTCIGVVILYGVRSLAKMHINETKKLVVRQGQTMLW